MDLRESITKLTSAGLILSLLEFIAVAGFTQLLGAAAIGSFFLFQTLRGILGFPSDIGISRAAETEISSGEPLGEVLVTATLVKVALVAPWVVALQIVAPHVDEYVGIPGVTVLVAVGLVTHQGQQFGIRVLSGQMKVHRTALLKVLGRTTWVVSGFALVLFDVGPVAIILGYIFGDIVVVLAALVRMEIDTSRPTWSRALSLIDFGRYVIIGSVGGFVYSWMDVAILRFFAPPSVVGAYEIAWRIAQLSMLLTRAVRESLYPKISKWESKGEISLISDAFYTWLPVPLYLTIPAFFGSVVLGREVLGTLFSPEVVLAYPVLLIFSIEKILRAVHLVLSPSLFAMNKPKLAYRGSAAAIVTNLMLNLLLIPSIGMIGAAIATMLSGAVGAAISIRYVTWFVDVRVPWATIFWAVGCAAAMALVLYVVVPVLPVGLPGLICGVFIGIVIYLSLMMIRETIRNALFEVVRSIEPEG